jgi:hypothetical protein
MELMIENIKKYREEYTGSRTPAFLQQKSIKKAHFEEDAVVVVEEEQSVSKTREKGKRKESRGTAGSKKMRRSPTISSRNLLIKYDESNNTKEAAAVNELSK